VGRPLSAEEQGIVLRMIELAPTELRESLRSGLRAATFRPGCSCGCGSFDLEYGDKPLPDKGGVIAEGFIDREPLTPIGVLLSVFGGRPTGIEFYDLERRDGDPPVPYPDAPRIRA